MCVELGNSFSAFCPGINEMDHCQAFGCLDRVHCQSVKPTLKISHTNFETLRRLFVKLLPFLCINVNSGRCPSHYKSSTHIFQMNRGGSVQSR